MDALIVPWIGLVVLAGLAKVAFAPSAPASAIEAMGMTLPFLALAAAPVIGYRAACAMLYRPEAGSRSGSSLARIGRWRPATRIDLDGLRQRGPSMFLASLIVGIILNVPIRALEFLAIVPAVTASDPLWVHVLVASFTADAVIMSFIYMACFVLALKSAPLFPRAMAMAWALDMAMQLGIATCMGMLPDLPAQVAAPLADILLNNVKKVAISVVIWLPYLLVSDTANLVFRQRVRLEPATA